MKNKHKIFLFSFLAIILLTSVIVYAQTASIQTDTSKVVSGEMINVSSEILKDLNSEDSISKTEVVYDELQNKNIYKMENSKYSINLDESKNLVGIYSKEISPIMTRAASFDKTAATEMIKNKYNELGLPADYELSYIEKYDDEVWQANFEKNYNGIYNKYESVKVFFVPENDEIVALTVFNEGNDTSVATVSKNDAVLSAAKNLNIDSSEIVSANLSMEKANDYFDESNTDTSVHTSWVLEAKDGSIVYVDASDNTVIGGDHINE